MKTHLLIIVFVLTAVIAQANEGTVVYDHGPDTYSSVPLNQPVAPDQDPTAERFVQLQKQLSTAQTGLANLSAKMRDNGHDQKYKILIKQIKAEMKSLGYCATGVPNPIRSGDGVYTPKYREPPVASFTTPARATPASGTPEAAH